MYSEYKLYVRNMIRRYFSRLATAEARISELEGISIESLKTEKQREQILKRKKKNKISRTVGKLQKV